MCFIIGLIMRRWTWKSFAQALVVGGQVISMVFILLVGALMFGRFAAWCNLSSTVVGFLTGLGLSSAGVGLLILLIFFILGFVVSGMALLMVGIPILYPVVVACGFDPIWWGVLMVLCINLGGITPPVGITLFAFKGIAKEIPIGTIYRSVWPFVLATVVVMGLIFIVPSLATWLPGLLK